MRLQGLQAIAHLQNGKLLYRETSFGVTALSANTIVYSDGEMDKMAGGDVVRAVVSSDLYWFVSN